LLRRFLAPVSCRWLGGMRFTGAFCGAGCVSALELAPFQSSCREATITNYINGIEGGLKGQFWTLIAYLCNDPRLLLRQREDLESAGTNFGYRFALQFVSEISRGAGWRF
jgi:hypothetical protein